MELKKPFSKQYVLDIIRSSLTLNDEIVVNSEKNVSLHLVKIFEKQGTEKYNLVVKQSKKKIFENTYKANYWYSVDEIFDFLQKNDFIKKDAFSSFLNGGNNSLSLPLNANNLGLKEGINLVGFLDTEKVPDSKELPKKEIPKKKGFDKTAFLKNLEDFDRKKGQYDRIKKTVANDFNLLKDYLNVSKTSENKVVVISSDAEITNEYEVEDTFLLMKEYLFHYLLNIPNKYSKEKLKNLNKDIYIRFISGKGKKEVKQLVIKIITSEDSGDEVINPIERDFSVVYVLCSLQDLMIDKTSLKSWLTELFNSNEITSIESIQF